MVIKMTNDLLTLKDIKLFLRISANEHDEILLKMANAAIQIAAEYIDNEVLYSKNQAIMQGIMTHIGLMYDSNHITNNLPSQILQFYKPYMRLRI
jgi:hypothetical protein